MMDVSILIVSYNTADLLQQCIRSVYRHTTGVQFEIIVVDNASADGSAQMVRDEFPEVILIEPTENLGFGKANNSGAKRASGTYLFLLNSDTILTENSVKILKDFIDQATDQRIAAVGCKLLDENREPQVSYGFFPSILQELFEYGCYKLFRKFYTDNLSPNIRDAGDQIKEVDYISGADLFFRKAIFDQAGGFDEAFFLYYEETELCYRLKQQGYKLIWNPGTSIIHYVGASGQDQNQLNYRTLELYYASKYRYYKKCHGKSAAVLVKFIAIPKILVIHRKADLRRIFNILISAE